MALGIINVNQPRCGGAFAVPDLPGWSQLAGSAPRRPWVSSPMAWLAPGSVQPPSTGGTALASRAPPLAALDHKPWATKPSLTAIGGGCRRKPRARREWQLGDVGLQDDHPDEERRAALLPAQARTNGPVVMKAQPPRIALINSWVDGG